MFGSTKTQSIESRFSFTKIHASWNSLHQSSFPRSNMQNTYIHTVSIYPVAIFRKITFVMFCCMNTEYGIRNKCILHKKREWETSIFKTSKILLFDGPECDSKREKEKANRVGYTHRLIFCNILSIEWRLFVTSGLLFPTQTRNAINTKPKSTIRPKNTSHN